MGIGYLNFGIVSGCFTNLLPRDAKGASNRTTYHKTVQGSLNNPKAFFYRIKIALKS